MEQNNEKKAITAEQLSEINKQIINYAYKTVQTNEDQKRTMEEAAFEPISFEDLLIGDPFKVAAEQLKNYIPPAPMEGNTPLLREKMENIKKDPHKTASEYLKILADYYKDNEQSNKKR